MDKNYWNLETCRKCAESRINYNAWILFKLSFKCFWYFPCAICASWTLKLRVKKKISVNCQHMSWWRFFLGDIWEIRAVGTRRGRREGQIYRHILVDQLTLCPPYTVFPQIVVATTILFWGSWCDNYSRETTIQGRKLLFSWVDSRIYNLNYCRMPVLISKVKSISR